jgi:hypothetical protein
VAYDFPAAPTNGQSVTFGSTTWQWDGIAWLMQSGNVGATGPKGDKGDKGDTGSTGPPGPIGEAPNDGQQYARKNLAWAQFTIPAPAPAVGLVDIGDTAPASPLDKQLYWQSSTGKMYIRYNDGNSAAWVQVNAYPTGNFLPTTGGTMTGDLTISKAGPIFALDKAASAQTNSIMGRTAGKDRWWVYVGDATAESGSNAGSDFVIHRFNDAGTWIDGPLSISRATGVVTATGLPPTPKTAAGVGQWVAIVPAMGAALVVPAGGTWAWFGTGYIAGSGIWAAALLGGIAAGGSNALGAQANTQWSGVFWRIA